MKHSYKIKPISKQECHQALQYGLVPEEYVPPAKKIFDLKRWLAVFGEVFSHPDCEDQNAN